MTLDEWYQSNPWQYQLGDKRSLPPGFEQSSYWPKYQSVLDQYTGWLRDHGPGSNTSGEEPTSAGGDLAAWLKNSLIQYAAGRSPEEWAQPTTSANLIGGGRAGIDSATVGQLALGGFGGAAMGSGVGGASGTFGGGVDAGAGAGGAGGVGGVGAATGGAATTPTLGQVGGVLSGGSALVNALNGGGQPAQGVGNTGGANTGGILGALLGGALGGIQGGNRPAGTTTTTTNQTLAPGGLQQLQNTISGQYLDPATNPYLNQTYDAAARQITPRVNSLFEASGRYGSGAHQGVLGQSLADLGTSIYGGNYNAERARQLGAAGTSIGSTVQNPYFTNPLAGILSGGLAGGVLGGGTNFLSGANGGILNGIGNLFGNSGGTTPGPEQLSGPGSGYTPPASGYPQELGYGGDAMSPSYSNSYNFSPQPATYPSPTSIDSSNVRRVPL